MSARAGTPGERPDVPARESGREYITLPIYLPHDTDPDIIYVFATKRGAPTNSIIERN
ncbi:hypothetical protein AB0I34_41665 [Kribbella sp. NPDC050281]|uniref:hypothetical protein n=1 Tax=Kribbella sp. NPDC050281 TaxID=3155515 RepID=UPI0033D50D4D